MPSDVQERAAFWRRCHDRENPFLFFSHSLCAASGSTPDAERNLRGSCRRKRAHAMKLRVVRVCPSYKTASFRVLGQAMCLLTLRIYLDFLLPTSNKIQYRFEFVLFERRNGELMIDITK